MSTAGRARGQRSTYIFRSWMKGCEIQKTLRWHTVICCDTVKNICLAEGHAKEMENNDLGEGRWIVIPAGLEGRTSSPSLMTGVTGGDSRLSTRQVDLWTLVL